MPVRNPYLAAYDVTDPNRLQAALHVLKGYACGGRNRCSVLSDRARAGQLVAEVRGVLDLGHDRFLLLLLPDEQRHSRFGIAVPRAIGFLLRWVEEETTWASLYLDRRRSEPAAGTAKRLVIEEPGHRPRGIPLALLERVVLQGWVCFDSGVLAALAEQGTSVVCLSARHSRRTAILLGPGHGDARRRLAQYQLALDLVARLPLAKFSDRRQAAGANRLLETAQIQRPDARKPLHDALATLTGLLPTLAAPDRDTVLGSAGLPRTMLVLTALFPPRAEFSPAATAGRRAIRSTPAYHWVIPAAFRGGAGGLWGGLDLLLGFFSRTGLWPRVAGLRSDRAAAAPTGCLGVDVVPRTAVAGARFCRG